MVKLFTGLIYSDVIIRDAAILKMVEILGMVDKQCEPFPFDFTHYYAKEMGINLTREFVSFKSLIIPESLPQIKNATIKIEKSFSDPATSNRIINIDPGYIALDNMILASTKDFSHRIYLADGIYGDLSYRFIRGSYRPLEWTYPDYRREKTIKIFNNWRNLFFKSIRKL